MVKEFGLVPAEKILDKFGYKQIYNDVLMEQVDERIDRFKRGELDINDYTVKGSLEFARALKNKGAKLYLASGTDREDVVAEAAALGYADLFDGRIYGSVGDISKYSKKMVIEQIMTENKLQGPELVVFGDGPVELRECIKREGVAIGVASDEIRRHGLNTEKRTRLIKAGAHVIIPDFAQRNELMKFLFAE
jgi:phosphoglycolate phosphatase-like HAD superfamily hydrolase